MLEPLGPAQIGVFALAAACFLFYIASELLSPARHDNLPSPDQGPLTQRFFQEPQHDEVLKWALEIPNDGLISYRGAFNKKRILVTSAAGAQIIHEKNLDMFGVEPSIKKALESLLGEGLVSAEGDEHRRQRRILQPVFSHRHIRTLYPLMWDKTTELISKLRVLIKASPHASIEIMELISRTALDIIGMAGFGLDFNCLANPDSDVMRDYFTAFTPSQQAAIYRLCLAILPGWIVDRLPIGHHEVLERAMKAVRRRIKEAVGRENGEEEGERKDVIGVLKKSSGDEVDMEFMMNQCLTMLGAGHDTVSQSIGLALYEISKAKDVQDRLREEIKATLPCPLTMSGKPDQATLEKIDNMPFLNAVLNESLRLHPIIPMLTRMTNQDVTLCGTHLPKGTTTVTILPAMNLLPSLWDSDPSVFDPERWMRSSNGGAKERHGMMTFGCGLTSCIGERFARSEMAFVVAGLAGCFEIEFAGTGHGGKATEMKLDMGIVLKVRGGLWLRVRPLEGW